MARSAVAFVAAVAVFATAFAPRRGLPARPLAAARRRAPAALHMNMFDRFKRVAKANANNLLGKRVAPRRTEKRALVFLAFSPAGSRTRRRCSTRPSTTSRRIW